MCHPALAAVASVAANPVTQIALTAIGTGLQIYGQQQQQKAQNNAIEAEMLRQRGFRDRQNNLRDQLFLDQRANVVQEDINRNERNFNRKDAAQRADTPTTNQALPGQGQASRAVASSGARDAQARQAGTDQMSAALARMGGFRRATQDQNIQIGDFAQGQQQLGSFANASMNLLPLDMQAAARAGQGAKTLGNFLLAANTLAGLGGLGGASKSVLSGQGPQILGQQVTGSLPTNLPVPTFQSTIAWP